MLVLGHATDEVMARSASARLPVGDRRLAVHRRGARALPRPGQSRASGSRCGPGCSVPTPSCLDLARAPRRRHAARDRGGARGARRRRCVTAPFPGTCGPGHPRPSYLRAGTPRGDPAALAGRMVRTRVRPARARSTRAGCAARRTPGRRQQGPQHPRGQRGRARCPVSPRPAEVGDQREQEVGHGQHGQRVAGQGAGEVAVQQVVGGAQRAAPGAVETGHGQERAGRVVTGLVRVDGPQRRGHDGPQPQDGGRPRARPGDPGRGPPPHPAASAGGAGVVVVLMRASVVRRRAALPLTETTPAAIRMPYRTTRTTPTIVLHRANLRAFADES